MTKEEITEAFENLRYFESTCEVEWGRIQAEADRAIEALKQGQSLPIDSVVGRSEQLKCEHRYSTNYPVTYPRKCTKCGESLSAL